jgi:hypothetical protein
MRGDMRELPLRFIARYLSKHRDNFAFTLHQPVSSPFSSLSNEGIFMLTDARNGLSFIEFIILICVLSWCHIH